MATDVRRDRKKPLRAAFFVAVLIDGLALLLASPLQSGAADPLAGMQVVVSERRNEAPDFGLQDADGKQVGLRDFRGKVVLLTFFTTW